MELVEQKAKEGGLQTLTPLPGEDVPASAEVIDLTELLRRSLKGNAPAAAAPAARKTAARREVAANDEAEPVRKAAARKTGSTARASAKPATRRKSG
jgi:DNA end-binding protein Ku